MNQEIKRRVFLSSIVATLTASPFAIRYFRGKSTPLTSRDFEKEFRQYERLVNVPVQTINGPERFALNLAPNVGEKWKYIFLTPSYFQEDLLQKSYGEPDVFHVREGGLSVMQAAKEQVVFCGKDEFSRTCYPTNTEELPPSEITLLVQDGRIYPAQEKDAAPKMPRDTQFPNLLTLQNLPAKDLAAGTCWDSNVGRIKPFHGYTTHYEILGFSEILGRKTAHLRFEATIPNMAALAGVRPEKSGKNEVIQQKHHGNAWFDLETGLLVRQETEIQTESRNVPGLNHPVVICAKFTVQLFSAES